MTIQQFLTAGALSWLGFTLARCAIDDYQLTRYFRKFKKGGFL